MNNNTSRVFDLPLCSSDNFHKGTLRITYSDQGLLYADYILSHSVLPDRLPRPLLESTLFGTVMADINAAIENNRRSLIESHDQSILS
jgi:hypothetical protein